MTNYWIKNILTGIIVWGIGFVCTIFFGLFNLGGAFQDSISAFLFPTILIISIGIISYKSKINSITTAILTSLIWLVVVVVLDITLYMVLFSRNVFEMLTGNTWYIYIVLFPTIVWFINNIKK